MLRWLCFWWPPCLLRATIVNLKDDPSTAIRGVLWSSRGHWLTFRDCSLLKAGQPPARMDGEVVIPRANVAFLQVVP
jgi:hypothetical protein